MPLSDEVLAEVHRLVDEGRAVPAIIVRHLLRRLEVAEASASSSQRPAGQPGTAIRSEHAR